MKKAQLDALARECDAMIEVSLARLQDSKKFATDQFTLNVRHVLNCTRLNQVIIEECIEYFEMLGMKYVYRPAMSTFVLSVDLLNTCVMNAAQAKRFTEIRKTA